MVRHVPEIRLNLIFTNIFDNEEYHNHFGDGKWKLTEWSLIVAKGKKCNVPEHLLHYFVRFPHD